MNGIVNSLGLAVLKRLSPETAHTIALQMIRMGLVSIQKPIKDKRLETSIGNLKLDNPIGLAAGFDKNAIALKQLFDFGFGFVEIGAITPEPQFGNQKPRVFRLKEDAAIINRLGFNNDGAKVISCRLKQEKKSTGVLGINIGANKDSLDRTADYEKVIQTCAKYADFVTINISSPNTLNLRELQDKSNLEALLSSLMKNSIEKLDQKPVFLKVAPDLTITELEGIVETAFKYKVSAIIATNTTLDRQSLISKHQNQMGGLSGKPLFRKSTKILAELSIISEGKLPLIGVGGVSSAEDAYIKICAGASAIQLYTALTMSSSSLLHSISKGMLKFLQDEGHQNISEAVGSKKEHFSKL